jgi:hypothetical protein
MKRFSSVIVGTIVCVLLAGVQVSSAFSRVTPRINARQRANVGATVHGIRNGSLSVGERAVLKAGRVRTHNMTQRFKSDGRLGLGERLILNHRAVRGHRVITGMSNN